MRRLGITAKIWLSIGVFVLGALAALGVGQMQGLVSEQRLAATNDAIFPASQRAQEADAAFQRMAKLFQDAVLLEDRSALDAAGNEADAIVQALEAAAKLEGLSADRAAALAAQAKTVKAVAAEARTTYAAMIGAGGDLTDDMMASAKTVAGKLDAIKSSLERGHDDLSNELRAELLEAVSASVRQRWVSLAVFATALAVAGIVVTFTIRRHVVQPVMTVVAELRGAAGEVTSASSEVASSSQALSQGATTQAASLEETSASMEEMASMTRQNADNSREAARVMGQTEQLVGTANAALSEMVTSMTAIHESSGKVAKIIKTIDEIAFQTNILALNAAVEAARAGEAGMGFAVVADEVRALAQRSAQAARDTAALIEESIARSTEGQHKVAQVTSAIGSITGSARHVKGLIDQVSVASTQQAQGIDQVTQAITQMEKVTQSTAATAEESAAASEQLSAQAETTMEIVSRLAALAQGGDGTATRQTERTADRHTRTVSGNVVPIPTSHVSRNARAEEVLPLEKTGTYGEF
jgi:methyl-accepting chemotaxis protein/methyl-accepting chemotaxis protein-1 (serine sensor receptor)